MTEFVAEQPEGLQPASATELSSRFRHCVTGYFGEPVFDHSGRYLIYAGFDSVEAGAVVLRDGETGGETVLAETPHVGFHSNSQRWICGDRGVLFAADRAGRRCPAVVWLEDSNRVQVFDDLAGHSVRHVSADGRKGYGGGPDSASQAAAIRRIDFTTGEAETVLTVEQVLDALPGTFPDRDQGWHFSHPIPNAAETVLFVKFQRDTPWKDDARGFPYWGAFLVADLRTGDVRSFGRRISGHPYWMPDDRQILNIKDPWDGSKNRHLVLVDSETGADQRLIDLPIEGPGHPSVSPDGRFVVTDGCTADGEAAPIYLVDIDHGTVREIARLPHRTRPQKNVYDPTKITRANPHPVWGPHSQRVVVNCNHDGRYMGLVLLDSFC